MASCLFLCDGLDRRAVCLARRNVCRSCSSWGCYRRLPSSSRHRQANSGTRCCVGGCCCNSGLKKPLAHGHGSHASCCKHGCSLFNIKPAPCKNVVVQVQGACLGKLSLDRPGHQVVDAGAGGGRRDSGRLIFPPKCDSATPASDHLKFTTTADHDPGGTCMNNYCSGRNKEFIIALRPRTNPV